MKILILSHNPITTYNAMGKTIASLFSAFNRDELCQLYIYPTIPDIDFCSSYYRITDKDVLKSYFKFSVKGRSISQDEINTDSHAMFENSLDEARYRNPKNKMAFRMILRDAMWFFSCWYNKDLKNWLKSQKPTCIFVAPGSAKFLYNIALKLTKELNIPIISYICDEFYFVKAEKSICNKIKTHCLKNKITQLMKKTAHIITICDSLKELYSKEFNTPATAIMTGTNYSIAENISECLNPKSLTYMGNIRCNRFRSLIEIGKALQELNAEMESDFSLKIYTVDSDNNILGQLAAVDAINLCGYVSGEEFDKVFHSSDILLHTEAFDDNSIDLVKNSVSTKIADSLASGICLFAYGPKQVASMKHLIDNNCAVTATDRLSLSNALKEVFTNRKLRATVAENGLATAKIYHDSQKASLRLKEIMENINEGSAS